MGILPKKEGGYPKRDIDSSRLQKVRHRLQSLLIDYKSWTYTTKYTNGLQKSDLDYKVY